MQGTYCQVPAKCHGSLDSQGNCCEAELSSDLTCCEVLDRDMQCCASGNIDASGTCNGLSRSIDVQGLPCKVCPPLECEISCKGLIEAAVNCRTSCRCISVSASHACDSDDSWRLNLNIFMRHTGFSRCVWNVLLQHCRLVWGMQWVGRLWAGWYHAACWVRQPGIHISYCWLLGSQRQCCARRLPFQWVGHTGLYHPKLVQRYLCQISPLSDETHCFSLLHADERQTFQGHLKLQHSMLPLLYQPPHFRCCTHLAGGLVQCNHQQCEDHSSL